ncbi:hypothetical protein CesoFtcFv8_021631 [Champsocephalus esox]|uniref:Uncharacterized protein n=1 Tax=Champsocephalus esox TaxID=159716 RepID=A0AAN8B8V5_9TELE|nr:hypothetical protein CesoFtcFv8_021631 [Champsocephalus esox]
MVLYYLKRSQERVLIVLFINRHVHSSQLGFYDLFFQCVKSVRLFIDLSQLQLRPHDNKSCFWRSERRAGSEETETTGTAVQDPNSPSERLQADRLLSGCEETTNRRREKTNLK